MWCDEIETGGKWVSRPIKPGSAERRTIHNVAGFVIVLGIVLIEAGATNVVEVAFEQSIVSFADMCWKAVSADSAPELWLRLEPDHPCL